MNALIAETKRAVRAIARSDPDDAEHAGRERIDLTHARHVGQVESEGPGRVGAAGEVSVRRVVVRGDGARDRAGAGGRPVVRHGNVGGGGRGVAGAGAGAAAIGCRSRGGCGCRSRGRGGCRSIAGRRAVGDQARGRRGRKATARCEGREGGESSRAGDDHPPAKSSNRSNATLPQLPSIAAARCSAFGRIAQSIERLECGHARGSAGLWNRREAHLLLDRRSP
jgi:hypothetical protein